jgi:predicted metal-dependent peptidase
MFEDAKVKMAIELPFFASLALYLEERRKDAVATTATDGKYLLYNEAWAGSLTTAQKVFTVAHEVMHLALGHLGRRGTRDPLRWNMACDYAIHCILMKLNVGKPPKGILYDPSYEGLSAEQIYDKLPKDNKRPSFMCDLSKGEEGLSRNQAKQIETAWKSRLAQAAMAAKMRGELPNELERLVESLLEPKVRWDELLNMIIGEVIRDDYDFMVPDRRLVVDPGVYLPDLLSEKRYVAVVLDTSGSRSKDDLKMSLSEAVGIIRSRGVSRVRLMAADCEVTMDVTLNPQDPIPSNFPGGGGTDFRPAFSKIENDGGEKPALLVYFTDGWGDFPKEPPSYPVLWIVNNGDAKEVPWGFSVQYESLEIGRTS